MGAFLASPVGSWLRVAIATTLTLWLADLTQEGLTFDWEAYLVGVLVAVLPIVIAFLNPADTRFGNTAGE
jgi:ABC-type maltose transport system permease subunit